MPLRDYSGQPSSKGNLNYCLLMRVEINNNNNENMLSLQCVTFIYVYVRIVCDVVQKYDSFRGQKTISYVSCLE